MRQTRSPADQVVAVPAVTATPAQVNKQSARQSLAWFNWAVALRAVMDALCGGTTMIFVAFALAVGVPQESIGRLGAATGLGCVFQVLVLVVLKRVRDRKRLVVMLGALEPLVFMAAVLVTPWLAPSWRLWSLLGAVFLAGAFLHMTMPIQTDWLASTIPAGLRGRYLGRRVQLLNLAFIMAMLVSGGLADRMGNDHAVGLGVLLAVGAGFGLAAVAALSRASMNPTAAGQTPLTLADVGRVCGDRALVRLLVGIVLYCLPFVLVIPLYQVYYQRVLGMPLKVIAWTMSGYLMVKVLVGGAAGRWVDRLGPARALLWSGLGYVVFFVLMVLGAPQRYWPVVAAWAVVGVMDSIFAIAYPAALYAVVPRDGARPAYFAVASLVVMGVHALGAVASEAVLRGLERWGTSDSGFTAYHIMLAMSALMMLPASFAALLLPRSRPRNGD